MEKLDIGRKDYTRELLQKTYPVYKKGVLAICLLFKSTSLNVIPLAGPGPKNGKNGLSVSFRESPFPYMRHRKFFLFI